MVIPSLIPTATGSREKDLLDAAEAAVRAYCGWHVAPVIEETVLVDGSGARNLFLRSLRVEEVLAVEQDGRTVDVDGLEWSQDGFLRSRGRWTGRLRGVKVTMRHGFESVPDVVEVVRAMAERAGASPAGVVREQAGQMSLSYAQTASGVAGGVVLMDHERAMLDRYRLFGGG